MLATWSNQGVFCKARAWLDTVRPAVLFIGSGVLDAIVSHVDKAFLDETNKDSYFIVAFATGGNCWEPLSVVRVVTGREKFDPRSIIGGICIGFPNYFLYLVPDQSIRANMKGIVLQYSHSEYWNCSVQYTSRIFCVQRKIIKAQLDRDPPRSSSNHINGLGLMTGFTYHTIEREAYSDFRDRGSKFFGYAYPVETVEECKAILQKLKKEQPKASHYCLAWRLGAAAELTRVSDDGEPSGSAGKPIEGQILSRGLTNVLVVVVRYFGGSLLGVPGLIHAYKTAASEALDNAGVQEKKVEYLFTIRFRLYSYE
jgi:uncharacterized YigZ family protein